MFDSLTSRLGDVLDRLKRRGALKEQDVEAALREVRVALLEADVALSVVRDFVDKVTEKAVGSEVLKSGHAGPDGRQDRPRSRWSRCSAAKARTWRCPSTPPGAILMVGLQGSGKTTTTGQDRAAAQGPRAQEGADGVARRAPARPRRNSSRCWASRPASTTLPIVPGQPPVEIARRAMEAARFGGFDVVLLDTAGRLHVDEALMDEVAAVRDVGRAARDAARRRRHDRPGRGQRGQDLSTSASALTGIVLTRVDGDARGGAALSMRAVTGCPIKLLGVGEKLRAHRDLPSGPRRRAASSAWATWSAWSRRRPRRSRTRTRKSSPPRWPRASSTSTTWRDQLRQLRKMGGISGLMGMLPGMGKMKNQMAQANVDESVVKRQEAIIQSMTPKERRKPQIIAASRKRRIAAGSGHQRAGREQAAEAVHDDEQDDEESRQDGEEGHDARRFPVDARHAGYAAPLLKEDFERRARLQCPAVNVEPMTRVTRDEGNETTCL